MEGLSQAPAAGLRPGSEIAAAYPLATRLGYLAAAVALGVLISGFWNFRVVDGFGEDVVAASGIRTTEGAAMVGAAFGFAFALVAGVAATFTACNCVAFAMIPGLVCARDAKSGRSTALRSLGAMLAAVTLVSGAYGLFVAWLGPEGVAAMNERGARFAQAGIVFSLLGGAMLVWGAIELGLADRLTRRMAPGVRAFFALPATKAAIMGAMIGAFTIGRPYPVFREFLLYAAEQRSLPYGAAIMATQGIGQVLVMVAAFALVLYFFSAKLRDWVLDRPAQPVLVSAFALLAGGAYFLHYWGIAQVFPALGRWGFRLGWYS